MSKNVQSKLNTALIFRNNICSLLFDHRYLGLLHSMKFCPLTNKSVRSVRSKQLHTVFISLFSFVRNRFDNEQNNEQYNKQYCKNSMYDSNRNDTLYVHNNNAGNQSNAVTSSHKNFKRGNLPFLFGYGCIYCQNKNITIIKSHKPPLLYR